MGFNDRSRSRAIHLTSAFPKCVRADERLTQTSRARGGRRRLERVARGGRMEQRARLRPPSSARASHPSTQRLEPLASLVRRLFLSFLLRFSACTRPHGSDYVHPRRCVRPSLREANQWPFCPWLLRQSPARAGGQALGRCSLAVGGRALPGSRGDAAFGRGGGWTIAIASDEIGRAHV